MNIMVKILVGVCCLCILAVTQGVLPSDAAPINKKSVENDLGDSASTGGAVYLSQEADPRAILKDGFYAGIVDNQVSILEGSQMKKRSYRLEEGYKVVFNGQEVDWKTLGFIRVPPHSVVRLVIFEGQVREIVLVEVSS